MTFLEFSIKSLNKRSRRMKEGEEREGGEGEREKR